MNPNERRIEPTDPMFLTWRGGGCGGGEGGRPRQFFIISPIDLPFTNTPAAIPGSICTNGMEGFNYKVDSVIRHNIIIGIIPRERQVVSVDSLICSAVATYFYLI